MIAQNLSSFHKIIEMVKIQLLFMNFNLNYSIFQSIAFLSFHCIITSPIIEAKKSKFFVPTNIVKKKMLIYLEFGFGFYIQP